MYVALALATVASYGHDYAPRWWTAALPLGAGITAAACRWHTDRRPERFYALAVGIAATIWTTCAWWASLANGWIILTAALGTVAAGIPRWWHYRRRGQITVHRGAPRGTRRELKRLVRSWPQLAEYMDLPGSHVQRVEADAVGLTFTLALRTGLTAADIFGRLARVESVLRTRPGAARLTPDPARADRVFLRVVRRDPLQAPMPWPGSSATSIVEPIVLGRFEDGEPVRIILLGEHLLIGGATGRGKSGVLNVILAELSVRADVVVWAIDMKSGLELAPWRPVLDRLATTDDEAFELLNSANRVLDARAGVLVSRGARMWRPSASEPAVVVLVDELAELKPEALGLFERVARLGRATAIILVAVTQRPSAAALGGLDARTQMTARVALGVVEARDTELILGAGRLSTGWRAERLTGPGYFLLLLPGQHEIPRPARAFWLADAAVRAVAGRDDIARAGLDLESATAASGAQAPSQDVTELSASEASDQGADEELFTALQDAPDGGLSADELAARSKRGRTWVYKRLRRHAATGRVVRLRRGRWAEPKRPARRE